MTQSEILRAARATIEPTSAWTKGDANADWPVRARDAAGSQCEIEDGVSYTLTGALMRIASNDYAIDQNGHPSAAVLLRRTNGLKSLDANDLPETDHATVLAWLDAAIAAAVARGC